MPEPELPLTGRCLCGAVSFEISAPLKAAAYCHCEHCRRRTGTAPAISGLIEPGTFTLTAGEDALGSYTASEGWTKSFCTECGGQVFTVNPEDSDTMAVRFGALDADPGIRPGLHQFVDSAAAWDPIPDDGLPRYGGRMPSS